MNINKKLELWTAEHLITEPQKNAIMNFEATAKRPLFLYTLLFLSSFCIGLGCISLIASNWYHIPHLVKLFGDFLLLASLGAGIYYTRLHNKNFLTEALLMLYAILILASIGLVAQIYQLPSHGYSAFLFWSILVSPLIYLSKKIPLSLVWIPVFVVSVLDLLSDFNWFNNFINDAIAFYPGVLEFVVISVLVCIYLAVLKRYFSVATITNAFKFWLLLLIITHIVVLDIFSGNIFYQMAHSAGINLLIWIGLSTATGALCYFTHNRSEYYWSLMLFIMAIISLFANILPENYDIHQLLGALRSFSVLSLVVYYAYKTNRIKLLNLASILIALRIFFVYIQLFGSLLATGLGLISSGIVFLAIAYTWQKVRSVATAKIKEQK